MLSWLGHGWEAVGPGPGTWDPSPLSLVQTVDIFSFLCSFMKCCMNVAHS